MTTAKTNETAPAPAGDEAAVWQPAVAQTDQVSPAGEPVPSEPAADTAVAGTTVHPRRAGRVGSVVVLMAVAALVVAVGAGFAAGRAMATGQTGTSQTSLSGANGVRNDLNGLPAGGPNASGVPGFGGLDQGGTSANVTGTVTAVTATSITIQLAGGATVTLSTASTTTYHSQAAASSSDVTTGSKVVVQVSGGAGTATDVTITGK